GKVDPGYTSGYLGLVPPAWRKRLGGPALTGQCCIPIISRTSYGPGVFAFNPAQLGRKHPVPARPLVYYTQSHHSLGPWNTDWDPRRGTLFNGATAIKGVVFPRGSRSVLFFGTQGVGPFCYGI